jgi:regulator of protease activity HflC (stomatin/prohibitin superfamily)
LIFVANLIIGFVVSAQQKSPHGIILGVVLGLVLAQSPRVARQWERAVVLRLGKYIGLRGPGIFWIVPFFDTVSSWIDQRVITTNFNAEETLTSDTVPVNVDAVLFWMVYDPEKAALEVQDYALAVSWAAQTALRDIIIPASLQDAMSREAQAAREKQARIILGQAEVEIASLFQEASKSYHDNPTALHLRAMNILYEGLKEKGALMLVPSTAVESMGLGGMLGAAANRQSKLSAGEGV